MALYRPNYKDPKTGESKQSSIWWYEFVYRGERVRESAKTTKKTVALAAEKDHRDRLEKAASGQRTEAPAERIRTVKAALSSYAVKYAPNHRQKSIEWVAGCSAHLEAHLGSCLLSDLTEERIAAYMKTRRGEGASNRTVNMELENLTRAIKRPWKLIWPDLKRLEEPQTGGRALSSEEQSALLSAAASNRSKLAGLFVRVALLTGMRLTEIRSLTWGKVEFGTGILIVGRAKTAAGDGRVIPLNASLRALLESHSTWFVANFGEAKPEWHLFPFSSRVKPLDPSRPITGIGTAWDAIRKAAGVQCRFHDLRHTVITTLAERNIPESTMKSLVGHVSKRILERYTHIRLNAKRAAVEVLNLESEGVPQESPKVALPKPQKKGSTKGRESASIN